jgi:hypothetical protein
VRIYRVLSRDDLVHGERAPKSTTQTWVVLVDHAEPLREQPPVKGTRVGRAPGPDDLIVPLPPAAAERRRSRSGEPFRSQDYTGKRWRDEDMPMLAWRYREPYVTKSTFISLVLEDGANPDVIENRVTHTKKNRGAFDGYDRRNPTLGPQWTETCTEVAKLQISRGAVTAVINAVNDSEIGWRRRESNPGPKMHQD